MKLRTALITAAIAVTSLAGCNRNKQDAIIKANEGDKTLKGDLDGAIAAYQEAANMDPSNHLIWNKLAQAYFKKPDWPKAAEAFANAIKADTDAHGGKPTVATYFALRGYALEQQAKKKPGTGASEGSVQLDYKEAEAPYLKCIELDPNYADCYFELGNVYLWMDNEQKSLEYYTKAIQHDPTQVKYYGPLAALYVNLGYEKEAEQVLKESQSFAKPDDPDPENRKAMANDDIFMAQILQNRGDGQGVVKQLEAARAVAPADSSEAVRVLYALGNAYANLDPPKKQDAIDNFKGFNVHACKGPKAAMFKLECATLQSRVSELGGTLQ
jgi:tetratricopeptide (TPR) repeat protein